MPRVAPASHLPMAMLLAMVRPGLNPRFTNKGMWGRLLMAKPTLNLHPLDNTLGQLPTAKVALTLLFMAELLSTLAHTTMVCQYYYFL